MTTDFALYEIKTALEDLEKGESALQLQRKSIRLPKPRSPRRFSDLVGDQAIKVVYENQNVGTYKDALRIAGSLDKSATRTFRKILNAVQGAYYIEVGMDAPKPRNQYLHRELLTLAEFLQLSDLSHEGIVEFLDDLCPCGKRHKSEAIRKLRSRLEKHGRL